MTTKSIDADVRAIQQIDAVPRILEIVCRTTGMGFSAVARVTDTRWIACAVRDEIAFGLEPGGELTLETTICNEIRASGELVVIDHVDADPAFRGHPTPRTYGFQSYISVPIVLKSGEFFGTLCAIDPKPHRVSDAITIHTFELFAELIAFHLAARDQITELEAMVDSRTSELQDAHEQLAGQREDERTRIARELHDSLGQSLTALKFDLDAMPSRCVVDDDRARVRAAADEAIATVDGALVDVDRIIAELRPMVLDSLGCVAAAEWQTVAFSKNTGIRATFGSTVRCAIPDRIGTVVFRVLQEALTNVARHAQASMVGVDLSCDEATNAFVLTVADDGKGLVEGPSACVDGWGLRGMRERVRALHGSLTIVAADAGGTRVRATVPLG